MDFRVTASQLAFFDSAVGAYAEADCQDMARLERLGWVFARDETTLRGRRIWRATTEYLQVSLETLADLLAFIAATQHACILTQTDNGSWEIEIYNGSRED